MSYYTEVDTKPSYVGGLQEMSKIVSRNIKYPKGCPRVVNPKIVVECIISAEGKVVAKRILENFSGDTACSAWGDALEVVDHLTNWIPAQCQGKSVASIFVFPIQCESKE
jgi:hypothetical protein